MSGESNPLITSIELTIFWMLVAVVVVALITKRIRLPYTVALVIAGLLIAVVPGTPHIDLTPELIVAVFLPTLVFEAAYNLDFSHLRENLRPVTILAIPGVLLTAGIVATLLHYGGGFDWASAFLFGAIVSATDPVSVVAVFRQVGAPTRLRTILEGESLFNDGTSIVVFNLILGIILAKEFDLMGSLAQFALVVAGGLILGMVMGYAFSALLRQVDDFLIETVLTIILAYGTFFLAQVLGVSGVIATVAAGLIAGNYARRVSLSPSSRIAVGLSWDFFSFVANSLIFLFVGLQIKDAHFGNSIALVALAVAAVLLARAVVVGLTGAAVRLLPRDRPLPWSWQVVLVWGGLRGALSLALALSIPVALGADRAPILIMTFGVILFTLLVQGVTIKPLLGRLRLLRPTGEFVEYESTQARLQIIRAALDALDAQGRAGRVAPDILTELRNEYQARQQGLRDHLNQLSAQNSDLHNQALTAERRSLLQVEKSTLRDLLARGEISEDSARELTGEIDHQTQELDNGLIEAESA